jgi:hypothetical protein
VCVAVCVCVVDRKLRPRELRPECGELLRVHYGAEHGSPPRTLARTAEALAPAAAERCMYSPLAGGFFLHTTESVVDIL